MAIVVNMVYVIVIGNYKQTNRQTDSGSGWVGGWMDGWVETKAGLRDCLAQSKK
jgi:hypothetical protein